MSPALAERLITIGKRTTIPGDRKRFRFTLDHGLPTMALDLRYTATLRKSAGANNNAVVRPDAAERLFELHCWVNGRGFTRDLVHRMSLEELTRMHALNISVEPTVQQPSAATLNGAAPADTEIELRFKVWASPTMLVGRPEKFWPRWDGVMAPEAQELVLDIYPATDAVNGSSDAGTGALLSAGSDTYEFQSGPEWMVKQEVAPGLRFAESPNGTPKWLPTYRDSEVSYTVADADEGLVPTHDHGVALVLLTIREDAAENPVSISDGEVNSFTIRSSSEVRLDEVEPETLEENARDIFSAYDGADDGDYFDGRYPVLLAPGGRTHSLVVPKNFTNFRYEIDHPAPANSPGVLQATELLLERVG